MCWDVSTSINQAPIVLFNCHGMKGNQFWKYNLVRAIIIVSSLQTDQARSSAEIGLLCPSFSDL